MFKMIRSIVRVEKLFNRNVFTSNVKYNHLWTSDNVVKSPCKDVVIPETSVYDFIWRDLDKWAKKTAMVCGITNRQYTYEEIYRQSQILGAKLRKNLKIKDGDTVAIMLPNIPEYPIALLGIQAAGAIATTFNPVYTAHELQHLLQLSNPKAIFVVNETASVVKNAARSIKMEIPIIAINLNNDLPEGTIRYTELTEANNIDLSVLKDIKVNQNDVAFLYYSSGTTGLPKGVELTHKACVANCVQQTTELRFYNYTTESNQDSVLAILPLFHSYGLNVVMLQKLSVGLKLVTLPRFQPETMVDALSKHKFDLLYLAPPTVLFLGSNPEITSKHFERLRCVVCGAAPLPKADVEKLLAKVKPGVHFCQGYGLTETGPLATMSPIGYKNYESVGFAIPSEELRIIDASNNNLGPNQVGELLVKGPNVMKGYKNNPEANKEVFLEGKWLRTGDLARIDENGAVYILDRLKELIKVSGFQVAPAEIESILKEHPAVFDAAVIGVKDPKTGERPNAVVVLNSGFKPDSKDIMKFVNERVAPFKKIKDVVFVNEIPKNASGKILRRNLVEKYKEAT